LYKKSQASGLRGRTLGALVGLLVTLGLLPGCILMHNDINPFEKTRQPLKEKKVEGSGREKILLLDISNIITDEEEQRPLGMQARESTVARVREALKKAKKDPNVRALILRIDSPGGGVTASDIVYREVKRFKEERQIPVYAVMMDTAASGGFYVALAADRIFAHPTTVTGSIGVVMLNLNVAKLFDKIGVADTTIKSGPHKDIGSPFRQPTESDRQILQGVIDNLYARFLERVREGRKGVDEKQLKELADGRILTADQALKAGLIDQIGYLDDAVTQARQAAGLEEASVVIYHRPSEYTENIYSVEGSPAAESTLSPAALRALLSGDVGPRFLYLWAPSLP
jgi:protease-4